MATYTTYDQVGLAEEVSDLISLITPTKVPFQSAIGTEKISSRNPEWQEDSLRAVTNNAKVEGFDATDADLIPTVMRSNYTQILEKTFKVSKTADAVKTYGRARETAMQLSKAGAELKRDLENTLVGLNQSAAVGDGSTTPRRMASVWAQISSDTTVTTADGDTGTAGTQPGALTEANFLSVMQKVYNEGGDPSIFMIKPADAIVVANFAYASGRSRTIDNGADAKTVVNAVDLLVTPFGEVRVVLNRFMKTTEALVFDPSNWKLLTLRPWTREMLAKVGDSERHMLVGEYSLKHVNQKASGRIANLA